MFWMSILPHATRYMMLRAPLFGSDYEDGSKKQVMKSPYDDEEEDDED
jgi:hypothetical protein